MKIKKLLQSYKKLLPHYQESIKNNSIKSNLRYGLCHAASNLINSNLFYQFKEVFDDKSYYKNYMLYGGLYIFPTAGWCYQDQELIKTCIQPRLEFLKTEIISLQKLLDEGYTDI